MASRTLSERAARLVATPKLPFSAVYYENLGNFFDPLANPTGLVNLGVAENRLASPLLQQRLLRVQNAGVSDNSVAYNPYVGSDALRRAIAGVLSRHVAKKEMNHEHLYLTSGTGSALWVLGSVIANPGEGALIPTPYYYAYDRDFTALSDCAIVPVTSAGGDATADKALSPACLDMAADAAEARGTRCKLLVLTSPSNPTGEVVGPQRVCDVVQWAAGRGIHVIANEIYACSVFQGTLNETPPGQDGASFRSVLNLFSEGGSVQLPSHVHFVWGLSKDFAANGLRCGCIYTDNGSVEEACRRFLYFNQVSGTTQEQLSECLSDMEWVDGFLAESRARLIEAHDATTKVLDHLRIPYADAKGSLFVWADFGKWIEKRGGELNFFKELVQLPGGGVLLCPGRTFHASRDGWFRICVAASPPGHLEVGLERIQRFLLD